MDGPRPLPIVKAVPDQPGSYVLEIVLTEPAHLVIGRLGKFHFPAGRLFYLGSARGPGGLLGRLRHHALLAARPRWHIDWLRRAARLEGGWFTRQPGPMECLWSQALAQLPGAALPAPGFGASDCVMGCAAHLVAFREGVDHEQVEQALRSFAADLCRFALDPGDMSPWTPA